MANKKIGGKYLKIDSSIIGMESARRYSSATQKTASVSLVSATVTQGSDTFGSFQDLLNAGENEEGDSTVSKRIMGGSNVMKALETNHSVKSVRERQMLESIREQCVQFLIKWLCDNLGQKKGQNSTASQENVNIQTSDYSEFTSESDVQSVNQVKFMQVQVTNSFYYAESESTDFNTQGIVRTADGREINFNLGLSMSRNFTQYMETNNIAQFQQMTDPLVINLDTDMVSLSDQKFEFDIDSDGVKDSISYLQSGSGFLALDKNGDGIINDGSELFGTKSGDGFADLMQYDQDGNGWIDENDEIFDKLLVWTKDESGSDALYTLKKAGVGAICLQKADTDFSLNSLRDNHTNGMIRSTGIFLYENGNVGTMQQLDVAT